MCIRDRSLQVNELSQQNVQRTTAQTQSEAQLAKSQMQMQNWLASITEHLESLAAPSEAATDPTAESWQAACEKLGVGVLALHKVVSQMKTALDRTINNNEAPSTINQFAHQLFDMIDKNADGVIDRAEFQQLRTLPKLGKEQ
eukprot:TRINITY_DN48512_c0_g2_i1.p4 TRINITY_DN48512_c0_g2~~TRINITY_DN48512_c0_g2_i1.p4  ORF type:complete len:143 (+),score=65.50 TRINITY_DN48512_c0_g2_i1:110-538(+)